MTPIDDKALATMEARMQAATPGPFTTETYEAMGECWNNIVGPDGKVIASTRMRSTTSQGSADGRFFAHARADMEALIAEVRRLRGELRNIATRGNNCECASHKWAREALDDRR